MSTEDNSLIPTTSLIEDSRKTAEVDLIGEKELNSELPWIAANRMLKLDLRTGAGELTVDPVGTAPVVAAEIAATSI